jgi:uncharacterized integral membrane protein
MTEGPRGTAGPRDGEPPATIDEPDELGRGGAVEPAREAPLERQEPPPGAMEPVEPGRAQRTVKGTRASALWIALAVGVLVLIAILIFVAQNSSKVRINFLWMHGTLALGIALLISAILGILLALAVGTVRMLQLRRLARRPRMVEPPRHP